MEVAGGRGGGDRSLEEQVNCRMKAIRQENRGRRGESDKMSKQGQGLTCWGVVGQYKINAYILLFAARSVFFKDTFACGAIAVVNLHLDVGLQSVGSSGIVDMYRI